MHTKEKEKLGICCREKEQDQAEQQTYEQNFLIKTNNRQNSEIQYFKNIEGTKSCQEKAAERN